MLIYFITTIIHFFDISYAIWEPNLEFLPDDKQFRRYESDLLKNQLLFAKTNDAFDWHSVGCTSVKSMNKSYIAYGGAERVDVNEGKPYTKKSSKVVLCTLNISEERVSSVSCAAQNADENNIYLGASLRARAINDNQAVVAFCDPLWFPVGMKEPKPGGKCYLTLLGESSKRSEIELCQVTKSSCISCMGGFSFDFASSNSVKDIQMVIGMPFVFPHGKATLLNDPFGSKSLYEPRYALGKYFNFGYTVAITRTQAAYVSAPLSDHYGPNVTNIRDDIRFTSPDNNPFSSFGLALETLSVGRNKHAVVIGAPYHTVLKSPNVGKVYLFCVAGNINEGLAAELHGTQINEFFGYALTNIGDINGDGTDDLAVSSPFLRQTNASGFISIFTVNNKCNVTSKPQQILKSSLSNEAGIFGVSITGGTDIDFNGWPDIVVANSQSSSVDLFVSRKLYNAKCEFILENNYEYQTLMADSTIKGTIVLSFFNPRDDKLVDINNIKKCPLILQMDPNFNSSQKRFQISGENELYFNTKKTVQFALKSLMHVSNMDLSSPVIFAFRFFENCTDSSYIPPLINWDKCRYTVPIKKYICSGATDCNADISLEMVDTRGTDIQFGYDGDFNRLLTIKIANFGPTEARDINFKVVCSQNLRIDKIYPEQTISDNQTYAVVKIEDEIEPDPTMNNALNFSIKIYFENFKDLNKMIYVNNSITVTLFSDVVDSNLTNNAVVISYNFIYVPNVTLSGSPSRDTVIDLRQRSQAIFRNQRLALDNVGPQLSQIYNIENSGKGLLTNITARLILPIQTPVGSRILYLFNKVRGIKKKRDVWLSIVPFVTVGSDQFPCMLPDKYSNPLNIIAFETHESHLSAIEFREIESQIHAIRKRSIGNFTFTKETEDQTAKISSSKINRFRTEIIQCNRPGVNLPSPICAEIICQIPSLPANHIAKLQVNAWLWADTFFKKKISDIIVYTTLSVDFNEPSPGVKLIRIDSKPYSQSQQFIFKNIKPHIPHLKELWPIIVGVVIGILLLAMFIVILYKCGFFKRNQPRRRLKSKKRKGPYVHILHPSDLQTASSISNESKTSHSELISKM